MPPAQIGQVDFHRLDALLLPGADENLSNIFLRARSFLRHPIVRELGALVTLEAEPPADCRRTTPRCRTYQNGRMRSANALQRATVSD